MSVTCLTKTAASRLPATFSFRAARGWLLTDSEKIVSFTLTIAPNDDTLTATSSVVSSDGAQVQATLAGGVVGVSYTLTCVVTTTSGFVLAEDFRLTIVAP